MIGSQALTTKYLDIYFVTERFEVLAALREEGLIRHLGVSNVDTVQLTEARTIAPW
jgi:aryl-alcohol dehydrogenase-like predicted oxidoreductase